MIQIITFIVHFIFIVLKKGKATHSSILAWKIPWTEEPGWPEPWGHRESDTNEGLSFTHPLISTVVTSAPPQIIRHYPEFGDPCPRP